MFECEVCGSATSNYRANRCTYRECEIKGFKDEECENKVIKDKDKDKESEDEDSEDEDSEYEECNDIGCKDDECEHRCEELICYNCEHCLIHCSIGELNFRKDMLEKELNETNKLIDKQKKLISNI